MPSILNSDDGVVSGTSGLKSTGGNDGITTFQQNGTERMRIDSSGNVGIGTSSPNRKLEISGGSTADSAIIRSSNSVDATYYREFGRNNSSGAFEIRRAQGGAATTDFTIDTSGNTKFSGNIGIGGTAPTTSGTGITFPATQSASSNANTLDDYEEGTWTPAFGTTGTAFSSITYSTQTGYYTKIGNMVYIWGWVTINTVSGGTGSVTVTGIPFANGSMQGGVTVNWADGQWTTRCPDAGHILANDTRIYLIQYGGTQTLQIPVGNAKAGSQWIFNGAYGIV